MSEASMMAVLVFFPTQRITDDTFDGMGKTSTVILKTQLHVHVYMTGQNNPYHRTLWAS